MSELITKKLVEKMIINNVVDIKQREEYLYTVQLLIDRYIGFFFVFIFALLSGNVVETALFLSTYLTIRKYAGGFHCKTSIGCLISSLGFVAFTILFEVPFLMRHKLITCLLFVLLAGYILAVGTVNNPNMNLSLVEYISNKRKSSHAVIVWIVLLLFFVEIGIPYKILIYFIVGIINVSLLMIIAKISKQEVTSYEKNNWKENAGDGSKTS